MSTTLAPAEPASVAEAPAPAAQRGRSRLAFGAVVALCCVLAAAYSAMVPPFEAPDEPGHYAYVQWMISGHGLPIQGEEPPPLQPEFSQPPLYYLVEAPLAWLAGSQPANLPAWEGHHNPFQNRTDYGNVNLYLHSPAEGFPWSGEVLTLHLMRLANVLFIALMVLATYGCAIELGLSSTLAAVTAATLGLIPQVLFLGGALNADNAIGSLSAAALYLLLRWLNRGPNLGTAALLGLAAGGAALSKLSGLVTVGLVLGVMAAKFKIQNSKFKAATLNDAGLAAAVAAAAAGWWYVRNWLALGDPLGWQSMLVSTGEMLRTPPLSFGAAFVTLMAHARSGLALFGWSNVPVHPAWYWGFAVLGGLGVAGMMLAARRGALTPRQIQLWVLVLWPAAFVVSLARWVEVNTAADQWRLLFPAYPALVVLLAIGWRELAGLAPHPQRDSSLPFVFAQGRLAQNDKRARSVDSSLPFDFAQGRLAQNDKRTWQVALVPAGLLALNVGAVALVIAPAYAGPQTFTDTVEHTANVQFGDALQLVGYSTPQPLAARTGDTVEVDLYWRVIAPMANDYATDIGIVDAQKNLTWKELSIPDEGRAPMSAWQPGEIVRDQHRLRVRPEMAGVQTLLLSVIDPEPPGAHLPASNGGVRLKNDALTLTRFMVLPPALKAAASSAVGFEDHVRLAGHTISQDGARLQVTLLWSADGGSPSKDYTVFVHMLAPDGRQVAQHDGQPGGGAYPLSLVPAGVTVPDVHTLDVSGLPAGDYRLEVGLYELASEARLGTATGDSSIVLPLTLR